MIGVNLKTLREERGLPVRELARRCDVNPSVISRIENGKTLSPRVDTVELLASGLGVEVEDLIRKPTNPQEEQLEVAGG